MAGNNIEWTSEQMIDNASSWSLAGDVALLNSLKKFSEVLLSETVSISGNVDNLLNNLENVSVKLDLVKNEFQGLRNTQFIENRVYEDDETLETEEPKKEEKELTQEQIENAVRESIVTGLKIMEKYFDKVEVAISDSEEDNDKSYILQPKDLYADRPLPYLVGTQDWYKKWHVGLLPSESESESEKDDEIYSSSDSEECLPKDRILGSETSSEYDFTNKRAGPAANSTFNDPEDLRRDVFHSSDASSEQSNSLPAKVPDSKETFAEQLAAKLGDVINNTVPVPTNTNPIKKLSQTTLHGDLFSDEPPPLDDVNDTVLPKTAYEGLFSAGKDLFADDADDESFWGQPNKTYPKKEDDKRSNVGITPKVTKGLFDESDNSSEDDLFLAAEKRKAALSQPHFQPFKAATAFAGEPAVDSTANAPPSKKKPFGGVSVFGGNSGNLGFAPSRAEEIEKSGEIEGKSFESTQKPSKKNSLLEESSDEDVYDRNKLETAQSAKKPGLFDDFEDESSSERPLVAEKLVKKKSLTLFDDEDDLTPPKKEQTQDKSNVNTKLSLFDDDDDDDLFQVHNKKSVASSHREQKQPIKKISLFDDDDDDDDDFLKDEDIFSSGSKKKDLSRIRQDGNTKKPLKGLFEDTDEDLKIPSRSSESHTGGLFDDLAEEPVEDNTTTVDKTVTKSTDDREEDRGVLEDGNVLSGSLFEDLGTSEGTSVGEGSPGSMKTSDLNAAEEDGDGSDVEEEKNDDDLKEAPESAKTGSNLLENEIMDAQVGMPNVLGKSDVITENSSPEDAGSVNKHLANLSVVRVVEPKIDNHPEPSGNNLDVVKADALRKVRKTVGFLDLDSDSDSGSVPGHEAHSSEQTVVGFFGSEKLAEDETRESQPQIYAVPPSIDLFDPNPPPPDPNWDAASDNSSDSDTFSFNDGILDRTSLDQSGARSSLFDEAPPSLDVNESSGIVGDLSDTRVETDDSSFHPHASSSRRLSTDIFNEQQSQDSFFVTKNRTDLSSQNGSGLDRIPESSEDRSSVIVELIPSGYVDDSEKENSAFDQSSEPKNAESMDSIRQQLSAPKPPTFQTATQSDKTPENIDASVKKNVKLFEENRTASEKSPTKSSPGKLKHNLNINVGALMPGAAQPRFRTSPTKSDETDKSERQDPGRGRGTTEGPPIESEYLDRGDDGKLEDLGGTEVLHSATKDRARIPVKRRPSTRKARQEAVRKSMTDFSLYSGSLAKEQPSQSDKTESSSKDNDSHTASRTEGNEQKDSDDETKNKGISLVFDEDINRGLKNKSKSELSFSSSTKEFTVKANEGLNEKPLKTNPQVQKKQQGHARELEKDLFKLSTKKQSSLFTDARSDSSDDDLFTSTKKSFRNDAAASSTVPTKPEEVSSKKNQKTSLFSDKSGSDSDSGLFGAKAPSVKKATQKSSLFDDSDDSEDDLYGSKTGSAAVPKRGVKVTTTVKKLENKEVTDFDPLSAFK